VLALPARAQAQQPDRREVQARELFVRGKYAEALDVYATLYAETAHPTYLRNVARCYQNLGDADKAIANFREYLRQVRGLPADERGIVEGYIHELEALKARQQPGATAAPFAPPVATSSTPAATSAPPIVVSNSAGKLPEDAARGSRRVPAYIVGAASVGALGLGAFFGARSFSKQHDSDSLCPMNVCHGDGAALSQDAKTNARLSDITVGISLVGVGVAAYLYFTSGTNGAATSTAHALNGSGLRLTPEVGPGHAGLLADLWW
jgi:hypothetical protein